MLDSVKEDALKRMNYVDGHLAGVRRMIEDDQYCVDVLKQTYAVRRAIQKIEAVNPGGPPAYPCHRGRAGRQRPAGPW
ncbi:MAG: metal-sensing transcriptional repressor [Chloroflexi bacterium]|nr:metal-sensing transcriptional repressor [Chloroflexota bacterium]